MQTIKWFSIFLAGLGAGAGITAAAAPGDLIYESGGHEVCITAPQAACFADCAIAAGTWSGLRSEMIRASAYRSNGCENGFAGMTIGLKSAPAVSLPVADGGVQVVGVE